MQETGTKREVKRIISSIEFSASEQNLTLSLNNSIMGDKKNDVLFTLWNQTFRRSILLP
jgi:hypothetical protein